MSRPIPEGVIERFLDININWNPDELYDPDWQTMTKSSYMEEFSVNEDQWREMVQDGAVRIQGCDTEVSRLYLDGIHRNRKPHGCKCQSLAHKLNGDGCDECNPKLALEHAMTTISDLEDEAKDKDALIRELVGCLSHLEKRDWFQDPDCHRNVVCTLNADFVRSALALARTTCPEAFEE